MSDKEHNSNRAAMDTNGDDIRPPPPSYAASTSETAGKKYGSPAAAQPETFYQAQPIGSSSQYAAYMPPGRAYPLPAGRNESQAAGHGMPSSGNHAQPMNYIPPSRNPDTVLFVVEDVSDVGYRRRPIPYAMMCFIIGLCTWFGYLFGMCYLRSPDPRERWWARACVVMCFIWSLIIIFAAIFARPHHHYYGGYK
ncbi:hypothetical protein B0O80DRAFT_458357 [Mortierella sp. GBAus27b]|nr:hypothetical protein B0O80DRAFT_458357 [Mortierella sp. GBAus27b]